MADVLTAAEEWFQRACHAHPMAVWPLLVWNSLPRAGASQFHGHAQVHERASRSPAALSELVSFVILDQRR